MSFSSELKEHFAAVERKRDCCRRAYAAGFAGDAPFKECEDCLAAFTAGAFVKSGTVTEPEKGFHFDIKTDGDTALYLSEQLTERGFPVKKSAMKNGKTRLYCKGGGAIGDLLVYLGATRFALDVIDREVIKKVRTTENRRANAAYANIDRAATAAAEQLNAIERLRAAGKLQLMSDKLRETARVREENPFMSLGELCGEFDPPLSKAGLSHRLQKLIEEAERL